VFLAGHRGWSVGQRRLVELTGFALILGTILLLDKQSLWPGWRAVLPVAGAALVLLAAREQSLWTGNPVAQWIGTRSYSIYLWHWPLVVALGYLEQLSDPLWIAVAVFASLALGHVSYTFIEGPARRRLTRMKTWSGAAALVVALA